jgi:hypothetical protein
MAASVFAVACAAFLVGQPVWVVADPDDLARRIKPGTKVFVTDWIGAERNGTVVDISARGITVDQRNGSRITVPMKSVWRVERVDRLWNGLLIGAAVVPTLYAIGSIGDAVSWTASHTAFTGLYALFGLWCDWLREGRANVFRAEEPPAVSFAPLIGPRAIGAGVRVSF